MLDFDLTKEERNAIASLKRLAKRWPKSLWLFSGGSLHVMRKNENGECARRIDGVGDHAVDPDYSVAQIDIENDGGDW